ncbi:MAG TPA: L,D-transpeptidase family protein [Candidatus Paceibacterota bacterium]|nr:L,D-transpeptidase family protein [Candidatus Paceibacterota bacterium]
MKIPSNRQFDRKGFLFFSQCVVIVIAVAFCTHYGFQVFLGQPASAGTSGQKVQLKGMEKNGTSTVPAMATDATATEAQFLQTRVISGQTLQNIIPKEGKFIAVDLVHMKVLLYQDGKVVNTLTVLSKGKPGSPWETPSGLYEVKTKERNHFSTIGKVNMPYSMQFFGNFFIHGWPTEPDGIPVPEGYSGGCVRLSTADAQTVYDFGNIGTGVFIYDKQPTETNESMLKIKNIPKPAVTAQAYMVADIDTGEVYAEKNASEQYPIASVTKLMTATVANETISFDKEVPVDGSGVWVPPDVSNKQNEEMSVGDLLYPLLLDSNNEVADSLARYYGTNLFLKWMNEKAKAIGMTETHYDDPSGLSKYNISTASDLFKLARYVVEKKSFILNITREDQQSVVSNSGKKYTFSNHTHFLDRDDYLGGKIGFTDEALETYVAIFKEPVGGEEHRIAFIVLKSDNRKDDVLALLNWFKSAAQV